MSVIKAAIIVVASIFNFILGLLGALVAWPLVAFFGIFTPIGRIVKSTIHQTIINIPEISIKFILSIL